MGGKEGEGRGKGRDFCESAAVEFDLTALVENAFVPEVEVPVRFY